MSVNLSSYSVPDLEQLVADAQQMIVKKQNESRSAVLQEIRRLASTVGVEVEVKGPGARRGSSLPSRGKLPPKYRNPADRSQTWTGRGPKPKWVKAALAKGTALESLAI